jgi:hypothetical protein
MTLYAYDGASPFDMGLAKQHGAVAITGYIVGHPGGFNQIDKTRVDDALQLGLGFVPNWERGASYLVTCGRSGGLAAGQEAVPALRALGLPDDGTISCVFSWDTAISASLYPQCGQVADGIIAGLAGHYLFSAYGQGGLIDYFVATGRMKPAYGHPVKGWLSGSSSFPGYNPRSPNVAMIQSRDLAGNWLTDAVPGTDINIITDPYGLHAHWPASSPYGGDEVFTDADAKKFWDHPIGIPQKGGGTDVGTAAQALHDARQIAALARDNAADAKKSAGDALARVTALETELAAIKTAVQNAAGGGPGIPPEGYTVTATLTPKT